MSSISTYHLIEKALDLKEKIFLFLDENDLENPALKDAIDRVNEELEDLDTE